MACGGCLSKRAAATTYVYTSKDGTKQTFKNEAEARAAVARTGGSYKAQ